MGLYCGIVNSANPCRCSKKVEDAIHKKRVNPNHLLFASHALISNIATVENAAGLIKSNPEYKFQEEKLNEIKRVLEIVF